MSHTMNIETELRDVTAIDSACKRLKVEFDKEIKVRKFYGSTETGMAVNLNGWRYPVVIKDSGKVAYDNYGGTWGNPDRLGELKAHYGIEKAKLEARKKGYSTYESVDMVNGNLKLNIRMGV